MRRLFLVFTVLAVTSAMLAQGGPPSPEELEPKEGAERGQGSEWNPDQQALLESLAKTFEIDGARLRSFRDEHLGWGEIMIGLEMTKVVDIEIDEIMGKRKAGAKWEEIASSYDIELEDVIREQDALEVITDENKPIGQLLSEAYGYPEEKLLGWKGDDLTWAALQIGLEAAKRANKPVEEILELYRSGWGWGDIAKANGFLPADIMREANNPLKKGRNEDARPKKKNDE